MPKSKDDMTNSARVAMLTAQVSDILMKSYKSATGNQEPPDDWKAYVIKAIYEASQGDYTKWIRTIFLDNEEAKANITKNMDNWLYNDNYSALADQLEGVLIETWPYKKASSAEGETIEIKFSNLITGESETVRFYRMWTTDYVTGERTGEQYGWEIQYPGEPAREVTKETWESEYKKYKGIAEQKENWNPLDDDLTGGGEAEEGTTVEGVLEDVVDVVTDAPGDFANNFSKSINEMVVMVAQMALGAVVIGGALWLAYTWFLKPKLEAKRLEAKMKEAEARAEVEAIYRQNSLNGQLEKVGQFVKENPELVQLGMQAGMAYATGGTSLAMPAMAQASQAAQSQAPMTIPLAPAPAPAPPAPTAAPVTVKVEA